MRSIILPIAALVGAFALSGGAVPLWAAEAEAPACLNVGFWQSPKNNTPLTHESVIDQMSKRPVVFLGEFHDNVQHHRWQLQTAVALHARNPNMVLALEMFPRSAQPVLDAWVRGELDDKTFLNKVQWQKVWRYDPKMYFPLFHFARMHRIPMVAMNVSALLIRKVRTKGWDRIAKNEREGVSTPAPLSASYEDRLFDVFLEHADRRDEKGKGNKPGKKKLTRKSVAFQRFAAAQATWDRGMAEAVFRARRAPRKPLVVGVAGQGHLRYGHGIPYQLADLGLAGAAVLLPWNPDQPCSDFVLKDGAPVADAVFGVAFDAPGDAPKKPKLGIRAVPVEGGGILVDGVLEGSVADKAGIAKNDVIVVAAGVKIGELNRLIEIIQAQAPGTWLTLKVRRGSDILEIIARFPPLP